jgi:hypothetical protein
MFLDRLKRIQVSTETAADIISASRKLRSNDTYGLVKTGEVVRLQLTASKGIIHMKFMDIFPHEARRDGSPITSFVIGPFN